MKVYLDYVFIINFLFDFILLLGIEIVLKRSTNKIRLFLGSVLGGISGFLILLEISSLLFFILKLLLGLLIVIITFSYKNIKYTMNNFFYLIILSILLGGTLYLSNIEISKTIFDTVTNNKLYIIILLIIGFITIMLYSKYIATRKKEIQNKYKVSVYINNKKLKLIGYLDTGNNLLYKNKPVLILNKDLIKLNNKKIFYIPYKTLSSTSIMKCIKLDKIKINEKEFKNIYLAISNDKFHLKDADIILNINLWEDKNEKAN